MWQRGFRMTGAGVMEGLKSISKDGVDLWLHHSGCPSAISHHLSDLPEFKQQVGSCLLVLEVRFRVTCTGRLRGTWSVTSESC